MTRFLNFEEFYYMLQGYEDDPTARWRDIFNNLYSLFDGTKINCYIRPSGDPPTTKHLNPYYTNFNNLIEDVLTKNAHRYIYKKFEGNTTKRIPSFDSNGNLQFVEQQISDLASFIDIELFVKRMINGWVERNGDRVVRTLSAAELDYNPIENYDRNEDMDETSNGSKTTTRELTEKYDPMEFSINAPISALSASVSNNSVSVTSFTTQGKETVTTTGGGASASDTQNGQKVKEAKVTMNNGELKATAESQSGETVKTIENVSTYDDNDLHKNRENESHGTVGNNSVSSAYSQTDLYGNVTITKDNPEQYKDTEAFENFGTNRNGRIHGNIGVTTTQQMIEQEYILRNKRLVDDFISECMNEIFLQCGA